MTWSTAVRAAGATGLFAIVHSALASLGVKQRVRRRVGARASDGLYRIAFNLSAVASLATILRSIWSLPDRPLYRVRGVPALLMSAGQFACVLALLHTNRQNGFSNISGIRHASALVRGQPIDLPPVVQHPLPEGACLEGWTGTFRLSSHPNNYLALFLYWLSPVMTVKWASVGFVSAVYLILGSFHEDRRLLAAYGDRYRCYRAQVPHLAIHSIEHWRTALKGGHEDG